MPVFDWDVEQGSSEWFKLRSGLPTASQFDMVVTPERCDLSKQRFKLAVRLIAERLLNWQPRQVDTEDMRLGREREPEAIRHLEFVHDLTTRKVGLVRTNDKRLGASPDRFVVPSMIPIETKAPSDPTQFEYLLFGHGASYKPQVFGQMLVCDADEAIFMSYNPRTPEYFVRTRRDEEYIRKLSGHLNQFTDELDMLTDKARALGLYQAYEDAAEEDVPELIETHEGMAEAIAKAGGDQE